MKALNFALLSILGTATIAVVPVMANPSLQLPENISRIEGTRDLNILQVEPTVVNERFYTSGACEHHQNIGNVLPPGAEIPDSDWPVKPAPAAVHTSAKKVETIAGPPALPSEMRMEGARDLNLIQVEPTVINESYYTSGRCERHQNIGTVLAPGSQIPDSDYPVPVKAR
jgi:hypothetical protein